jgi:cellulose synthase/poly-beta-1,6-N-acetylglucosamine synthase-like glycosyltransferase
MGWIPNEFFISLVLGFNYFVIFYFAFTNSIYLLLLSLSAFVAFNQVWRSRFAGYQEIASSPITPPVSILVPAHNEKFTLAETTRSLLNLEYPSYEVIIINDGSTDGTLESLIHHFNLYKADLIYRPIIPTGPVKGFYVNPEYPNLTVIDKPWGGKSESLNVGINASRSPYFCSVDADTILEKDALLKIMKPVLESEDVVASGGIVRVLDGCTVEGGRITKIDLPKKSILIFQVVEYLRSFLFGRTGWSALKCLLVLSGAFSVFQKKAVQEVGGYLLNTVTEDFDMIIRLHRRMREKKIKYSILFVPEPVSWTQVPDQYKMLARQRRRWQRGLVNTLLANIRMFFNRRYGWIGWIAMPYTFFIELLGPIIELLGYVAIALSFYFHLINLKMFWLFLLLAFFYGIFLSVGAIFIEEITYRRYPQWTSLIRLMIYGVLENLGYRQINAWWRMQALVQVVLRKDAWERAPRRKFYMPSTAHDRKAVKESSPTTLC